MDPRVLAADDVKDAAARLNQAVGRAQDVGLQVHLQPADSLYATPGSNPPEGFGSMHGLFISAWVDVK